MALTPHVNDPKRAQELKRRREDPASFGVGGSRTQKQREMEAEAAKKREAELIAEAKEKEIQELRNKLEGLNENSKEAKRIQAKITELEK